MHRHPDGPGLVGDGSGDGLPNPPGGICRELVSLCPVKFIYGADQAGVTLLNQVQNVQASAGIFFRDGHNQSQVCLGQLVLCLLVAFGDSLGKFNFLLGRQQAHLTDFLQVHSHRVVQIILGGQIHRVDQLLVFHAGQVDVIVQIQVQVGIVVQIHIQLSAYDLDVHGLEAVINLLDFFGANVHFFQLGIQLGHANHAVFPALGN